MDALTHKYIVENSLRRLFSDNKISNNIIDMTKEAFTKLFVKYSVYPDKKEKRNMFLWHFYNPNTGQNYIGYGENALSRFKYYSQKAFDAFKKEKKLSEPIIKDLAYACHYLADLNEPHHTSNLIGVSIGGGLYLGILINNHTKHRKIHEIAKKSNERLYRKNDQTKSLRQSQIREDCKFTNFTFSTEILYLFSNHMEFEAEILRMIKANKYHFNNEVHYNNDGKNFMNTITKIGEEFAKKSNAYSEIIKKIEGLAISDNKMKNNIYIKVENSLLNIVAKSLMRYNKNSKHEKLQEFVGFINNRYILQEKNNLDINIEDIINKILDNSIISTIQFLSCFLRLTNQ